MRRRQHSLGPLWPLSSDLPLGNDPEAEQNPALSRTLSPFPHLVRAPGWVKRQQLLACSEDPRCPPDTTSQSAQGRPALHQPPPLPTRTSLRGVVLATLPLEAHRLSQVAGPVGGKSTGLVSPAAVIRASTEKGQLRMEIPLVLSHGQQGLFKEYIQLKIDFSV